MVVALLALDAEQIELAFLQVGRAGQDQVRIVQGFVAQDPSAQIHPRKHGRRLTQTAQVQAAVGKVCVDFFIRFQPLHCRSLGRKDQMKTIHRIPGLGREGQGLPSDYSGECT